MSCTGLKKFMSYQTDNPQSVYDELRKLEAEIIAASSGLKNLGEAEAEAVSIYEGKKNGYLIQLYAEESEKGLKRTEAMRVAMYRKMYEIERLKKALAAHELKAQSDYIKSLLAVLNSTQSRLKVLSNEREYLQYIKGA